MMREWFRAVELRILKQLMQNRSFSYITEQAVKDNQRVNSNVIKLNQNNKTAIIYH